MSDQSRLACKWGNGVKIDDVIGSISMSNDTITIETATGHTFEVEIPLQEMQDKIDKLEANAVTEVKVIASGDMVYVQDGTDVSVVDQDEITTAEAEEDLANAGFTI